MGNYQKTCAILIVLVSLFVCYSTAQSAAECIPYCRVSSCLAYCNGFENKNFFVRTCPLNEGVKLNVCDDLVCENTSESQGDSGCYCCCGYQLQYFNGR
ncbi:hypothetical protein TetV_523 [Tetraselmis virus 1]|uniref:Uncharacterized protein n=1 Tax=Tetraselmis virus 1 TaxID=2060617 RepID=A0A2P0VNX9_9VIRU|nr:hypothetical protein QJ968_gp531 [Tetraselmis virus 1]AUF82605.1 hypothetical protein TetV_523 [Tetraselmis virus 1]